MRHNIDIYYRIIDIRREDWYDPIILKALTVIHPATGLFETVNYNDYQADTIANLSDQACLCIYSMPKMSRYNYGNELFGRTFKNYLIKNSKNLA